MTSQRRWLPCLVIASLFPLIACNLNTVMLPAPTAVIGPSELTSGPSLLIVSPTAMPPADTQPPPAATLPQSIPPATPIPTQPDPTGPAPIPGITELDGAGLGVTYNFHWQLSAAGDAPVEQQHTFRVTGLVPPSPSSSSRSLFLLMTCEGSGFDSFRWGMASQGGPTLGCGDNQSGFVSVGAEVFTIVAVALPGAPVELTYSLQIHLGNPY